MKKERNILVNVILVFGYIVSFLFISYLLYLQLSEACLVSTESDPKVISQFSELQDSLTLFGANFYKLFFYSCCIFLLGVALNMFYRHIGITAIACIIGVLLVFAGIYFMCMDFLIGFIFMSLYFVLMGRLINSNPVSK